MNKKNRSIVDTKIEHYGKWVATKSFNNNKVIAYWDDEKKIGSGLEEFPNAVIVYVNTPCEILIRGSLACDGDIFEKCKINSQCDVCKYERKNIFKKLLNKLWRFKNKRKQK